MFPIASIDYRKGSGKPPLFDASDGQICIMSSCIDCWSRSQSVWWVWFKSAFYWVDFVLMKPFNQLWFMKKVWIFWKTERKGDVYFLLVVFYGSYFSSVLAKWGRKIEKEVKNRFTLLLVSWDTSIFYTKPVYGSKEDWVWQRLQWIEMVFNIVSAWKTT